MASGWQGAPYFRRYGRELVSKPTISLKKSWGGGLPLNVSSQEIVQPKRATSTVARDNNRPESYTDKKFPTVEEAQMRRKFFVFKTKDTFYGSKTNKDTRATV